MTNFADRKRALTLELFDIGAVKFGEFKLKIHEEKPDEPLSPVYFDLRSKTHSKGGPLDQATITKIGELLFDFVCSFNLKFHQVAGVPEAGDPIAEAFSLAPRFSHYCPLLKLSKEEINGRRRIAAISQGKWRSGDIALLVDDVVTGADSKLEAIKVLESYDIKVRDVLVVIDREQGGREALEEKGYNLYALFTASELVDLYLQEGKISQAQAKEVKEYIVLHRVML